MREALPTETVSHIATVGPYASSVVACHLMIMLRMRLSCVPQQCEQSQRDEEMLPCDSGARIRMAIGRVFWDLSETQKGGGEGYVTIIYTQPLKT